jgi:hypothetical protein
MGVAEVTVLSEHPAPSSIPPSRVMPAIVAKQLNELGKACVQTEGFRDATDVVMESVSCDLHAIGNAAIQGLNCREFGNFGRRRIQRGGKVWVSDFAWGLRGKARNAERAYYG